MSDDFEYSSAGEEYEEESYTSEEGVKDTDDFERKAEKYRKMLKTEGRIATKERQEEMEDIGGDGMAEEFEHREQAKGLMKDTSVEEMKDRIHETVQVLANFNQQRDTDHTREEYLALLRQDLMDFYEYNDYLMDRILEMFPPGEACEFLEGMEKERPLTIRTNTIKVKRRDLVQSLQKRGMNVEPLEKWSKVGLQVFESNVAVGGTLEYLAGHYMVQSAVSFLPVMALQPQEGEKVLDMAAAPGGKTTYACAMMKNTGVVFANDVSEVRAKSLNGNIQRLGIRNCIVTNYSGVGYATIQRNFDRVLLDAPCTGSGIISRDKSIKTSKSAEDVQRASNLQRQLLLSAIDCCNAKSKTGGYVVYSTCSFLVEEDEAVVDYALRKRFVEVVEMDLPFGRPGFTKFRHHRFNSQVEKSRRFFPHVHNMDGFYVCKLRKLKDGERAGDDDLTPAEAAAAKQKVKRAKQAAASAVGEKTGKKPEPKERVSTPKLSVPPTGSQKRDKKQGKKSGNKRPRKQ